MANDIKVTILTLNVMTNSNRFLNVLGTILISETGKTSTSFDFSLTSTRTDGVTDFALTISPVPEPGTLFLVGSGLLGIAGILFRKAKRPISALPSC
jgi:hypothetical protein